MSCYFTLNTTFQTATGSHSFEFGWLIDCCEHFNTFIFYKSRVISLFLAVVSMLIPSRKTQRSKICESAAKKQYNHKTDKKQEANVGVVKQIWSFCVTVVCCLAANSQISNVRASLNATTREHHSSSCPKIALLSKNNNI